MKTIVEFFDQSYIKNLLATIALKPQKLIIAIDDKKVTNRNLKELSHYLNLYEKDVYLEKYSIDTSDIDSIMSTCQKITSKNQDVAFNITGGGELVVSAITLFCKENNLPAFFIDLQRGKLVDTVNRTYIEESFTVPKLSVEKIIALNGATFTRSDHYVPDICDDCLTDDLTNIFNIFLRNSDSWYGFVAYMQEVGKDPVLTDRGITISAPSYIEVNHQRKVRANNRILKDLEEKNIISHLIIKKDKVRFTVKNELILEQLKLQGSSLEQFCYINSAKMDYFDDVKMSVIIDADGPINDFAVVQNEIDLICVKGITPIFVSCKSSVPSALSLSEVKQLANKYGGETAKAVLACSAQISTQNASIYKRAMEMSIFIIEKTDLNVNDFPQRMKEITEGSYKYVFSSPQ